MMQETDLSSLGSTHSRHSSHLPTRISSNKAFEDCARGRSVTVVWYCREVKDKMYECFRNKYVQVQ